MFSPTINHQNFGWIDGVVSADDGDRTGEHCIVSNRDIAVQVGIASYVASIPKRDSPCKNEK